MWPEEGDWGARQTMRPQGHGWGSAGPSRSFGLAVSGGCPWRCEQAPHLGIPINKFTLAAGLRLDSKEEDERREGDRLGSRWTYRTGDSGSRLPAGVGL